MCLIRSTVPLEVTDMTLQKLYSTAVRHIQQGRGVDNAFVFSVHSVLLRTKHTIATAESLTGGMVGMLLTQHAGSSSYFRAGTIAYCNEVKIEHLGVPESLILDHTEVSEEVARAMATGVRQRYNTTLGISTTGIAGPSGGSTDRPVGTVCIAVAGPDDHAQVLQHHFSGSQKQVRELSAVTALFHLMNLVESLS